MFREHILTCFIADPIGLKLRDDIGVDNMCWEQDYPHSDSSWPQAPEEFAAVAARFDVSDADINKITHENAMRWYRFDPFAHRPREQCTVGALRAEVPDHDVAIRAMDKGRFAGHAHDDARRARRERDRVMTTLRDDYSGPFDPDVGLADFSRKALAPLGREYLLHGHLQDRVGIPLVLARHTRQDMLDVAIEEWMAASPLYSLRTQRALNFGNGDVPTIFKNIQLDIGAPHQFMDFRYKVDDAEHGEFWLDALRRAHGRRADGRRVRARHVPRHRGPDVRRDRRRDEPVRAGAADPPPAARAGRPRAALPLARRRSTPTSGARSRRTRRWRSSASRRSRGIAIDDPGVDAEPGGWFDYSGEFDPDFTLEDLSHRALVVALQEAAVQTHLLAHAYLYCVAKRWGLGRGARERAAGVHRHRRASRAGRLPAVLGITGDDAEAIAKLLQLHPVFQPRTYVAPAIE